MRRRCLLLALLFTTLTPAAASASSRIIDVPVAFRVQNTNTSQVPCASDGATYVVRGHLTGPRAAIEDPAHSTATLYYEGFESGEWNWRFRRAPRYDYAAELAALGHVSVTIDQVGYGASGHPFGFATCFGAQADIAHQIIGQLRDRGFGKVVLAGHDIGGGVGQDQGPPHHPTHGPVGVTWEGNGQTPYLMRTVADANARCAAGGEPAYEGGPGGYVYFPHV